MRLTRLLIRALLFLTFSSFSLAQEIKLPEGDLPSLNITAEKQLGTRAGEYGLAPGAKVSNFTIKDHFGKDTDFSELQARGPLLVIFYRGGWCPYCNRQIYELTQAWPDFKARKVTPVLISVDKPDAAALASRTYEIPFPVLSDPQLKAHEAFKVILDLSPDIIERMEGFGISLSDWSGETHNKIAVSSAFLVDRKGSIEWSHSDLDYATRPSVPQLLSAIDSLH